jgi:uncharacterized protein YyaL (SSP411 family)
MTVKRTLEYVLRDLISPEGLFISAEDADSEGVEGKYYVWSYDEIIRNLGKEEGERFASLFNITNEGNFRDETTGKRTGKNILHLNKEVSFEEVRFPLEVLLKERYKRIRPGKDGKVLTDWNSLMISALARAGQALDDRKVIEEAVRSMEILEKFLRDERGRWYHRYMEGERAVPAMLDDIAFLTLANLDLYEATFEVKYMKEAISLVEVLKKDFLDETNGGFFQTAHHSEKLISRQKEAYDGAMPSGNSAAIWALIRLSRMTGRTELEDLASRCMNAFSRDINRSPTGFSMLLSAYSHAVGPSKEIVIARSPFDETTKEMLRSVRRSFLPNKVVLLKDDEEIEEVAPFTRETVPLDGRTTAYVCEGWNCDIPTTDVEKLRISLRR